MTSGPNVAYREDTGPKALPRGAELINYGNTYKVIWDLGDGLGHAWYDIDKEHLKDLFESENPPSARTFDNWAHFNSTYKDPTFWGNIAEVSLKAETPWDGLKDKIFNQFGHVPGLDNLEIKRLLMQSFWEGWSENQWTVEYRKTDYFNSLADNQRQWVGKSEAEKVQSINEVAVEMANFHRGVWGTEKSPGSFRDQAEKIASGASTMEAWQFDQRSAARQEEGTPEFAREQQEQRAAAEEVNLPENMGLLAENQWRSWVGPVDMPSDFSSRWGNWLASGERSEADLENYLKQISQSRWAFKPPDLAWADWSASYKSQIRDELELPSLNDKDPLLNQILSSDLTGQDLTQMIRQDNRFRSTEKMYGELSSAAADMGRRFGFIS